MSECDKEIAEIYRHIDENFDAYVEKLRRYIKQKSVSSQDIGVKDCAKIALGFVKDLGAEVELVEYDLPYAQPIVYGKLESYRGRKTLINYHMYDTTQVPDPERWISPPWEARIVELPTFGKSIVGRGAINSKGPSMAFINALNAIKEVTGDVPVNLFLVLEGEEEIESPSLEPFVKEHLEELKTADAEYSHRAGQDDKGIPRLMLGNKGELDLEFEVVVRPEDTHSGSKPVLDSAVWRLIWAFNSLCDSSDEIAIDGWRDEVKPPTDDEMELLKKLSETLDEEAFKASLGKTSGFRKDVQGLEMLKAYTYEPTLNINLPSTRLGDILTSTALSTLK
jgi:acetylornithine deacetylase/succinyl-diaminopimelate desuccinylase-like protein